MGEWPLRCAAVTAFPAAPSPYGPGSVPDPGVRRRAAVELGVLQGLYLLFLIPWFMVAFAGAMAAGTSGALLAVLLIYTWFAYPVVAVGTTIAAWVLFATGHPAAARWVNRVPLLWVVVGAGILIWVFTAG